MEYLAIYGTLIPQSVFKAQGTLWKGWGGGVEILQEPNGLGGLEHNSVFWT